MKYKVMLFMSKYVKVGDDYQMVDISREFIFSKWDDVQNLIGYLVEGASGAVKLEIEAVREEA